MAAAKTKQLHFTVLTQVSIYNIRILNITRDPPQSLEELLTVVQDGHRLPGKTLLQGAPRQLQGLPKNHWLPVCSSKCLSD